jgi:hypothetical protein
MIGCACRKSNPDILMMQPAAEVGAYLRSLVPCGIIIRQINGQIARMQALPDTESVMGHAGIIEFPTG